MPYDIYGSFFSLVIINASFSSVICLSVVVFCRYANLFCKTLVKLYILLESTPADFHLKMISINSSPVTQTSGLLTQLFQLETKIVTIGNSYVRLVNGETISSSVVVNVTNDKLSMCRWKFETAIRVGHMTITSELLDVVKNSEVKLTLDGVVLYPDGRESDIRSTKVKSHQKYK